MQALNVRTLSEILVLRGQGVTVCLEEAVREGFLEGESLWFHLGQRSDVLQLFMSARMEVRRCRVCLCAQGQGISM